jgi:hypothetical protein
MTSISRYRKIYALLLRLYPKKYRERYAEPMEQTFSDLLRERAEEERSIFGYALYMFADTSVQIIRTNFQAAVMKNKRLVRIIMVIVGLLLIPLIAMQFTNEMDWSLDDFIAMGIMLSVAGAMIEIGARMSPNTKYRIGLAIAVFAGFTLMWVNLAVGIIGSENNPANWLFVGVLGIGIIGAIASAFKARGMAVAALVTACAQFLVPIVAFLIWKKTIEPGEGPGVAGIFALNFFWVLLWLVSWRFFKNAAQAPSTPVVASS